MSRFSYVADGNLDKSDAQVILKRTASRNPFSSVFLPCILFDVPITGTLYRLPLPSPQTWTPSCQNAPGQASATCHTGDSAYSYEVSTTWVLPPEPCGHLSMHTALRTVIILRLHRIVNFCMEGRANGQGLAMPFAHKDFPLVLPCKVFQPLYLVHD